MSDSGSDMDREYSLADACSSPSQGTSAEETRSGEVRVLKGHIFNIQRFSTEDGPGIRTTVFMKGCPLTCLWCSNPESQNIRPEIAHSDGVCDRCGHCVTVCDLKAIAVVENGVRIDRELCDNCGKCVSVCGPRGLRMMGSEVTVDAVFDEIEKDKAYYRNSGGGVTCSGGEALSQQKFVAELFRRCQEARIHTTLDTCGFASEKALKSVLEFTDFVLFDLKLIDNQVHIAMTGRSNKAILENAKHIAASGVGMIIRVPLIPDITDTDENITAIAQFVKQLRPGLTVNVLPYHRFGMNKYQMLDRDYPMRDAMSPSLERAQKIVDLFESFGLPCDMVT